MSTKRTTIFVCVSCKLPVDGSEEDFEKPGRELAAAVEHHLRDAGASDIEVRPVECLSVCKRACTIAFTGHNKWTYLVGDVDAKTHAEEISAIAQRFAASEDGILPWKERPLFFRKGVIARVPPETYRMTEKAE
jgi:predicted metal-binding protein